MPGELDAVAAQARALREWFRGFVKAHGGAPLEPAHLTELDQLNRLMSRDQAYSRVEPRQAGEGTAFEVRKLRRWSSPETLLQPLAEALAAEIGARAVRLDVTDLDAASKAVRDNGPFDILVNNAGQDQHAFFTDTTPQQWRQLLAVNLEAVFATVHAALPGMQAARWGRIVNVGSEAGRQGSKGGSVYAAAKGGLPIALPLSSSA